MVEASSKSAFNALLEARDYLLNASYEIHAENCAEKLKQLGLFNAEIESVLKDESISDYERFIVLKEMV